MKKSIFVFTLTFLSSSVFASQKSARDVIASVMSQDLKDVVARHKKELNIDDARAQLHEKELKRYLAMCIIHPKAQLGMFSPEVDNVWHNFILFTREYTQFCHKNTGGFLHHAPTVDKPSKTATLLKLQDFTEKYKALFNENPPAAVWPQVNDPKKSDYGPIVACSGECIAVTEDCFPGVPENCRPWVCIPT